MNKSLKKKINKDEDKRSKPNEKKHELSNEKNKQNMADKNIENNETIQKKDKKSEEIKHDSVEISTTQEEENIQLRDEKLRLLAEMENLRKRFEREKVDSIKFGSTNLARDILSLNDNLSRALENIPDEKNLSEQIINLVHGLKMVKKEFMATLEKHGVKKIEALNKKFDHNIHQAMLEIETDEHTEGVVVQEIQSGYTIYDRLLRPTMVGVSKKIEKNKENK